jgi:hypothetical protein
VLSGNVTLHIQVLETGELLPSGSFAVTITVRVGVCVCPPPFPYSVIAVYIVLDAHPLSESITVTITARVGVCVCWIAPPPFPHPFIPFLVRVFVEIE